MRGLKTLLCSTALLAGLAIAPAARAQIRRRYRRSAGVPIRLLRLRTLCMLALRLLRVRVLLQRHLPGHGPMGGLGIWPRLGRATGSWTAAEAAIAAAAVMRPTIAPLHAAAVNVAAAKYAAAAGVEAAAKYAAGVQCVATVLSAGTGLSVRVGRVRARDMSAQRAPAHRMQPLLVPALLARQHHARRRLARRLPAAAAEVVVVDIRMARTIKNNLRGRRSAVFGKQRRSLPASPLLQFE